MESLPMRKLLTISLMSLVWATSFAQQEMPARVVQVASVERTEIAPTIAVPGTIHSRNEVRVTAGVAGQLLMVAEPGTLVQEGEPVALIDRQPLLLQRAEQEALLQRAEINVRQLESQLRRQQELRDSDVVSEFELEQTQANRDLALSDAKIIRARIHQIDDQIRRTAVRAPFTGVVISRAHRAGEDIARGEPLARLTDLANMEVRAFVPLKHLSRTVVGETIRVFAGDAALFGRIRALVPTGDVRSQTFEARIDLPAAASADWAVGQLVSVGVPIRARENVLAVPRDALVLRHNGSFVFRINDENKAEQVEIEIGDSAGDLIGVSGALSEGDRVAIRGAENLRDGMATKSLISSLDRDSGKQEG
jgi:RND family efflux transporter MFP subunit